MKKLILNIFFSLVILFGSNLCVKAVQFDLLVLPVDIFSVCDNYFCFPEVSNIVADDVIKNMAQYNAINTKSLTQMRDAFSKNNELKSKTQALLTQYRDKDKIDFPTLQAVANYFGVKSVLLINSYAINDKTDLRRNLWDILEIGSAFKLTYPFELKTNAVLTDCVNKLVMWSGKYSKDVSDTFGYYSAANQMQAMSQLEKIMMYSNETLSKNISQNVFMRFFPRDVRTFTMKSSPEQSGEDKKFVPNALQHLADPHIRKEFDESQTNSEFRKFGNDDVIYQF